MKRAAGMVSLGALAVVGGVTSGCGPSFQAVYEGDARFEHCYALEENPSLAMREKAGCWDEWLHGYTYGQTRDRVDYALSRSRALRAGGELPTDEAMMQAAPGEGRDRDTTSGPRNAFAPPPKTLGEAADAGGSTSVATSGGGTSTTWGVAALVPGDAGVDSAKHVDLPATVAASPLMRCTDACRDAWTGCRGPEAKTAASDAKVDAKKIATCDRNYRACLRVCAR